MKKILFNTFALIGFGTFIFLACSVAEPEPTEPQVTTNEYGKYQMTDTGGYYIFHVLDTETGEVRTYYNDSQPDMGVSSGSYNLVHTTQTF